MSYVSRINADPGPDQLRKLYDEWAATYHQDLTSESQNYVAPALTAQAVLKTLGTDHIDGDVEILDAGCGTGWVGTQLAKVGAKHIDGNDISEGMLKVARQTGVYRDLNTVDLSRPLTVPSATYDVVTCIGTFLSGHVGPEALPEFVRILKTGGIIVATVRDNVWEAKGYKSTVKKMVQDGKVEVISVELSDYRKGANVEAYMLILKRLA